MVKLTDHGVVLAADGTFAAAENVLQQAEVKTKTMAYGILKAHNHSDNMESIFCRRPGPAESKSSRFPTSFPTATTPSVRWAVPSMRTTMYLALETRKSTAAFSFRHTGQCFTSTCVR